MTKRSGTGLERRTAKSISRFGNRFVAAGRGHRCSCRDCNVQACRRRSAANFNVNFRNTCARPKSQHLPSRTCLIVGQQPTRKCARGAVPALARGQCSCPFPSRTNRRPASKLSADSHVEPSGIRFSFMTGLPGDLNRFVIERVDLDASRGRLYFTRGDCRFELTVTQSVLRNGDWVSVPLAQVPTPKG